MAKTIVIGNRKGGSGKTTTAKNLAYDLTLLGKKVLLVDADPQCNCTNGVSTINRNYKKTIVAMLKGESIEKCIYHTRFENLDILPGNSFLASEEIKENIFVNQLQKVNDQYDYIFIDTSPYFNLLIAEILKANDLVIIPAEVTEDSIDGLVTTINELQMMFDSSARYRILYTKVDSSRETKNSLQELYDAFKDVSFSTAIRYNYLPVRRSRKNRVPISKKYRLSKVARDYESVALELLEVL